jgi:putative transposase
VPVNPQYTSQECSSCGKLVKKSLSVRTHVCTCGYIDCRDTNAAKNVLKLGLRQANYKTTTGRVESNACGENLLYSDLETSLSKRTQ